MLNIGIVRDREQLENLPLLILQLLFANAINVQDGPDGL